MATTGTSASPAGSGTQYYEAILTPDNNSGVSGTALVAQQGNTLDVTVNATGLTPNQVHPLHIHGFLDGRPSTVPTSANDFDHDGYINAFDSETAVGPVMLSLTDNPQLAVQSLFTQSGDIFPTADAQGNLSYHETFNFNLSQEAQFVYDLLQPLGSRYVELHGANVSAGTVAGSTGPLSAGYHTSVPVAGGLLHPISTTEGQTLSQTLAAAAASHVTLG